MKTDPEHADYSMEQGATRNYEPWREKDRDIAEAVAAREEEERGNAMKACRANFCLPPRTSDPVPQPLCMLNCASIWILCNRHSTSEQCS
jgi:hypothetical protein